MSVMEVVGLAVMGMVVVLLEVMAMVVKMKVVMTFLRKRRRILAEDIKTVEALLVRLPRVGMHQIMGTVAEFSKPMSQMQLALVPVVPLVLVGTQAKASLDQVLTLTWVHKDPLAAPIIVDRTPCRGVAQ